MKRRVVVTLGAVMCLDMGHALSNVWLNECRQAEPELR